MNESTTSTREDGDVDHPEPSGKFSFIRAAAGFVLEDPPEGGVFAGPAAEPAPPRIESVHPVDLPPMVVRKPPATPMAHRLMVVALIPFVLVAIIGLIVINRPSPRRQQPAPAPTGATVPTTEAPTEEAPPTAPATTPPVLFTPAPTVPTTRAPRVAPVAQTTVPPAPTTTPTTEPEPTTTPTTEPAPATTTTTEPPPTTTTTTESTTTTTSTLPPE